jgi:hypothetical protein
MSKNDKNILFNEINIKIEKIHFLEKVYDIEANKINNSYKILNNDIDYDFYNKLFFNTSIKDLDNKYSLIKKKQLDIFLEKEEVIELLEFTKRIFNNLNWDF